MPVTLLISDTHIGARAGHGVLERPAALAALCAQLAEIDRLVILGDLLELNEGRPVSEIRAAAAPILDRLGRSGPREILFAPGNHDRRLIRPWIDQIGPELALEQEVPAEVTPLLSEVVERLAGAGAQVRVHYPGLSLSEQVWVTHGHLLDRALAPPGPYGFVSRTPPASVAAYERRAPAARGHGGAKLVQERLLVPGMAPLVALGLDWQMRRHSLPALARVLGALGVRAEHVVFGHVHRVGPLAGDRARAWSLALAPGRPPTRFLNTGSWVREDLLLSRRPPSRPYRPGGAVRIGADGIPRPVELLR